MKIAHPFFPFENFARENEAFFKKVIEGGFQEFQTALEGNLHRLSSRTKANAIRDFIIETAKTQVVGRESEGISFLSLKNGLEGLFFDGKRNGIPQGLFVRFKKLTKEFLASNIATNQAVAFAHQGNLFSNEKQGVLPGFIQFAFQSNELFSSPILNQEPLHLNAGYVLDRFGIKIECCCLAIPETLTSNSFTFVLPKEESNADSVVVEFPEVVVEEQAPRVRVRVKENLNKKSETK